MRDSLVGAIEAGGTKFVCALARGMDEVLLEATIPTTTPPKTMAAVTKFFDTAQLNYGTMQAIGVASFGPVDVNSASPTWGHILSTPKPGWSSTDLLTPLKQRFGCPLAIDTDVNAAALAEAQSGAAIGCSTVVYVTVGTGIGGGVVIAGRPLHGSLHPEMGHVRVQRDPRDRFEGVCPFHQDCLEGMASGPAIRQRWGVSLDQLPQDHAAYSIVGNYLGQLAATILLMFSSERIIFGGGVMKNPGLLPHIRDSACKQLNGYLPYADSRALDQCIVAPGLGQRSGIRGAMALALSCLE